MFMKCFEMRSEDESTMEVQSIIIFIIAYSYIIDEIFQT